MYPKLVFSSLVDRKRFTRRSKKRRNRPQARLRFEQLEERTMLAADCYADLFAGPRLADLDSNQSEILEGVFNALLPGSHVDLTVADWNAVGDSNININAVLTQLAADLGVSTPAQALSADVTLAQFFDAAADVIPADGDTADLHAALFDLSQDVNVPELTTPIQLEDILDVTFPDGSFADVELNTLNLVTGMIQLYNYENVATTNDPVTLSGTLFNDPNVNTIELWAQVIEPPIIDPVVYAGDQFYSAAMRLKMNVDLVDFTVAGTAVEVGDLELYYDIARAQGEVTDVHSTSEPDPAVTVQASHGVTNVYLGEISDSLFFNRTHVIDAGADLDFTTVGSVDGLLGTNLDVEAKGYAEGTAPFSTALEFFGPFPETQTTGTSATFIDNALDDLLQSLEAQVTLDGVVVSDPTGGIGDILVDVLHEPLVGVLSNVADPALDYLGVGIGEMDVTINSINCPPIAHDDTVITPEDTPTAIDILDNDEDTDGGGIDPTTVTIISGTANGTLSVDPETGIVTYSPDQDYNGPDSFTYTVQDTEGAESNVATVDITVTPVPDPPEAVDDAYETNEDTTLEILDPGVLGNDFDVDGDSLTTIFVDGPSNGTVSLSSDGSFEYTPDPNFNGIDTFTYKANDGQFDSNVATVTITVLPVPDPPEAVDDAYSTDEDVPLTVQAPGVLENDSDVDGDSLTSILVSGASNGAVSLNDDGSFTYTPNANFNGQDSFTYQANDGELNSNVATVTIDVTPVNDPPVAADDSYSTQEDTTLSISTPGVLANDSDVEGDDLSSMLVDGPSDGTLSLNSDGSFDYTPNANFNGIDTFTYKANDGELDSNIATVTINVTPVNDAPVAVDDAYETDEDTDLTIVPDGVLGNDSDVENDPLTSIKVSDPSHGSVTLSADGSFTYSPDANFNGTDSFTYKANDGDLDSNVATVTITVNPINDAPVAADDSYSTLEDTPLEVPGPGILENDSDVDGDSLSSILVDGPSNGTLSLNSDGSFTYTPDANFNGVDSYTYQANDGQADSNVATVTIDVIPVNDAPVAADDAYETDEDTALTITAPGILGNDSDVDGDSLTSIKLTDASNGTVSLNSDGSFTYTPDANFNGTDSFTYKANDGTADSNRATVTVTVNPVNDPPVAADDSYSTDEDTTLTVEGPGVLANDNDVDGDPLTSILVDDPANGSVSLNSDGSFDYTPDANFNGMDSFTYKANDGQADSNVATVNITVGTVNDPPVAADDSYNTDEDTPLTVAGPGVLGNDSDVEDDPLTAKLVGGPSHGSVELNSDGSFTYKPDGNFNGSDSFTYQANDGLADSNVATVTITIAAVNDAPVAIDDSYSTNEDTTLTVNTPGVLGNDSDVDGDPLSTMLVDGPEHGTLELNPDGSFSYTPDADYNGPDGFTYKANDGDLNSNVATVSINVIPVNDAPVAADDSYVTDEDTPLTVSAPGVLGNDSDVDGDPLSSILVSGPEHGTLSLESDGSLTYTPDANFNGGDSFTYKANDGSADSNIATVDITVLPVNDAPAAADDSYTTSEDTTLTVNAPGVLANDNDADGDSLSVMLVDGPSDGTLTLNSDGSFTYTPDENFSGSDSFTYKANDGSADSNVATANITVTPVNDAPVANDDNYNTQEDTSLTVSGTGVLGNDSDADGDSLSANLVSGPSHGTVTLNGDGSFTYTPDENYNGPDGFTYQANDGEVDSNVATVNITVESVNDVPVAADDSYSTDEDTTLTVSSPGVLANDDDVDGDSLTSVLVDGPSNGTLSLNPDGSFSYTPDADYSGPDSFTYKANDGSADSNMATVNITVNPINDPPVAVDDAYTTEQNQTLTVVNPGVQANDSDVDSDTLTSLLVSGPSDGTVTLSADGSFTYTPDHNFFGDDSFTYRDNDGSADSNVATVSITVTPQQADLSLDMTVDDATPNVGGEVVFTITVDNGGPTRVTGVAVSDSLPSGVTFDGSSASQGSYDPSTGTWTIGTMENGASATLQITATVNETGAITNTAEVSASDAQDPDSTPGNNNPLEDDQDSETIEAAVADAQITHTNTTVGDFLNGDGDDLEAVEYGVRKSEIGNVAPGVFFYYVSIEAPSTDFTIFVDQSENHATFDTLFDVHNGQVNLYDENGFTTRVGTVAIANGDVTIDVAGATAGDIYTVQVKWNPDTVKGESVPDPSTVSYLFATSVDSNFVSQDGVDLVKKGSAMVAGPGGTFAAENSHLDFHPAEALPSGNYTVYVDIADAQQYARAQDAIDALNASVSNYGASLSTVSSAAAADIRLTTAASSFMGGVNHGILGFADVSGDITLIDGWNWYTGPDPNLIGSNQYDFQTVVTHELTHAFGLDHYGDPGSLMYGELTAGAAFRASGDAYPDALDGVRNSLIDTLNMSPWLSAADGLLRRLDSRGDRSPVGTEPLAASKSHRLAALDHILSHLPFSEDDPDEFGTYKPAREDDPDWPTLVDALLADEQESADNVFAEL